jgi:hypothetical protein
MEPWQAALLGAAGAAMTDLVELDRIIRRKGSYDPPDGEGFWLAFGIAIVIRMAIGAAAGLGLEHTGGALIPGVGGVAATKVVEICARATREDPKT